MKSTRVLCAVMCAGSMLASVAASGQSVKASPTLSRRITAVPRVVGRTARNMVTFHDRLAAVQEWAIFAADTADLFTTVRLLDRFPTTYETHWLMPRRPTHLHFALQGLGQALLESSFEQYSHELLDGKPSYGAKFAPLLAFGYSHGRAALDNVALYNRDAARQRLAPSQ